MNLQGETYMQELAEGAEPQDLLEAADIEVASLRAEVARLTAQNHPTSEEKMMLPLSERLEPVVLALCDPENQPHQWINAPAALMRALGRIITPPKCLD